MDDYKSKGEWKRQITNENNLYFFIDKNET